MAARPRLVDAWELEDFCSNADAPDLLHELVFRLLRASDTVTKLEGFRTREGLRLSGWDGATFAREGSIYVPAGDARWELSTKRKSRAKADADYKNRVDDPQGVDPAETALVLVSMRRWPGSENWCAQKRRDNIWADVKVLDADDLEKWLWEVPDVWRWVTDQIRPAPLPPAPSLLPPGLRDFVGREPELDRLRSLCQRNDGGPLIITITGKPGVGKTALAVQFAQELGAEFVDGQLYADLRGTDRTPVDPATVQSGFLQSMQAFNDTASDDNDYLTGLYRTAFHNRRVLLVLDNASDEDQVRRLLPASSTSAVLVTSRYSLAGLDGADHVHLDTFDKGEALALMSRIVGEERVQADPESTDEIVEMCGKLPLAIRIAGILSSKAMGWGLAHLALKLRDEHNRLDYLEIGDRAVRASFALSYNRLPKLSRILFRRLSLIPGHLFDYELASQIVDDSDHTGKSRKKLRRHFNRLANANLIERAQRPESYTFHDLIRLFSSELAEKKEGVAGCEEIQRSIVKDLLNHAYHGGLSLDPTYHDMLDSQTSEAARTKFTLHWLDKRQDNILDAISIAATKVDLHGNTLVAITALHLYLKMRNSWLEMEKIAALGLQSLDIKRKQLQEHQNDPALKVLAQCEMRLLVMRAEAASSLRDLTAATAYCDQAFALAPHADSPEALASAENMYGNVLRAEHRDEEALKHYQSAAQLTKQSNHVDQHRTALYNIGNTLRTLGRLREALGYLQGEMESCIATGHRWSQAITLNTLGITVKGLGQYAEAKDVLSQAVALFDEFNDLKNKGNALFDLGNVQAELGEHDEALLSYRQDYEICRSLKDEYGAGHAAVAISRVLTKMGPEHLDSAFQSIKEALETLSVLDAPAELAQALTQFASVADLQHRFDEAEAARKQATELFRQQRNGHSEALAYHNMGVSYWVRGATEAAIAALRKSADILASREEFGDRVRVFRTLGMVHAEAKDHAQAQHWYKAARESRIEQCVTNV